MPDEKPTQKPTQPTQPEKPTQPEQPPQPVIPNTERPVQLDHPDRTLKHITPGDLKKRNGGG